jgi:hypothetical protein
MSNENFRILRSFALDRNHSVILRFGSEIKEGKIGRIYERDWSDAELCQMAMFVVSRVEISGFNNMVDRTMSSIVDESSSFLIRWYILNKLCKIYDVMNQNSWRSSEFETTNKTTKQKL